MNNIIAFNHKTAPRTRKPVKLISANIISIVAWKAASHPIRTPNGVFFSGDAA